MTRAVDSLNRAAVAASQAGQLYDLARAEQLEARIDLLGLAATPERYAMLQRAIDVRFHNATIGERAMLDGRLRRARSSPRRSSPPTPVPRPRRSWPSARNSGRSIVQLANDRGMAAFALEVFMGLILFDYTDDPAKKPVCGT